MYPNTKEYYPSSSEECPKIERLHCPDSGELCPETNEEQFKEYVSCLELDENACFLLYLLIFHMKLIGYCELAI